MKNQILVLLFVAFSLSAFSQLPNGDFENWTSIPYSNPNGWLTGNNVSINEMGVIPVTEVAGVNGSAIRMETFTNGSQFSESFFSNTQGDPTLGEGGFPYSEVPTAITGNYRYSIPGNDTAILLVVFKAGGTILSSNVFMIKGTGSQPTFTAFSFPISMSGIPDSVIIAAASSNLVSGQGIENGSFLELDDLAFDGTTQAIPGGDFDNWTGYSVDHLIDWNSFGSGVERTADSYSGNWAVLCQTIGYGGGQYGFSGITLGQVTNNGTVGGIPYTLMMDTLTGYYKYESLNGDTGMVGINLSSAGTGIGGGGMYFVPTATYTYFTIPFGTWTAPDTLRIDFNSSTWPVDSSSAGSKLYIDHLELRSQINNVISHTSFAIPSVTAFPVPAQDVLNFHFLKTENGNISIQLFSEEGKMVLNENGAGEKIDWVFNVKSLPAGNYFYQITTPTSHLRSKFAIIH